MHTPSGLVVCSHWNTRRQRGYTQSHNSKIERTTRNFDKVWWWWCLKLREVVPCSPQSEIELKIQTGWPNERPSPGFGRSLDPNFMGSNPCRIKQMTLKLILVIS